MNTKTLLHTAAPYLLLAVLFAIMMQQAQYGFVQPTEDSTIFVLQQMAQGVFPQGSEYGPSLSSAPIFLPFFQLWMIINGSADGFIYFARLVVTALSFVVALALFQVGSKTNYRNAALFISAAILLLPNVRLIGVNLGLCMVLLTVSGLLGWCAYRQTLHDDGSETGYARVLLPFCAGLLIYLSFQGTWFSLILVLWFIGAGIRDLREQKCSLMPLLWAVVGAVVGFIIILIYLLGFDEPSSVIPAYLAAPFNNTSFIIGAEGRFVGACSACVLFVIALIFGIAYAFEHNKFAGQNVTYFAAGILILAAFAQGFWIAETFLGNKVELTDGPAEYLIVNEDDAALYEDVQKIAKAVGDDDVQVRSRNNWMPLVFENFHIDKDSDAPWIFLASDHAYYDDDDIDEAEESSSNDFAVIMENSAGTLYRTASKQSYISQG